MDNEQTAYQDITSNKNMQVFILGDIQRGVKSPEGLTVTPVKLKDIDNNNIESFEVEEKHIKSLIVSEKMASILLNQKNFKKLDRLLDKGYSIYFLGDDDYQDFIDLTSDPSIPKAFVEKENLPVEGIEGEHLPQEMDNQNYRLGYSWVTKNASGKLMTGNGYFTNTYTEDDILEKVVVNAWHRQDDHNVLAVNGKETTEQLIKKKLMNTASAAELTDFSVGKGWRTWGWVQQNYYSTYGDLTLWRTFADLWHNGTTPYIAFVGQAYLDPKDGSQNWGISYGGDVDYAAGEGYTNKLYQYAPMSAPSTTTWNWSLGGSLSGTGGGQSGLSGTIGASFTVGATENDVDVYLSDFSSPSSQLANVFIGYKDYDKTFPSPNRSYVIQTSRQDFSTISQVKLISSKTKLAVYHQAYWYQQFDNDKNPYSSAGGHFGYTLSNLTSW